MKLSSDTPQVDTNRVRLLAITCIIGAFFSAITAILFPQYFQLHWQFDSRYISAFNSSSPADCFNWPKNHPEKVRLVHCTKPHYFEVTAALTPQSVAGTPWSHLLDSDAPYPDPVIINKIRDELCVQETTKYLGRSFDKNGIFSIDLMYSNKIRWKDGDRVFRCGVVENSAQNTPIQFSGEIKDLDPSPLWPTGICLSESLYSTKPVSCSEHHHLEVIGAASLALDQKFPDIDFQNTSFDALCRIKADRYLGDSDKLRLTTLTILWDSLTEQGWQAGEHTVNCYLGAPIISAKPQITPKSSLSNTPTKTPASPTRRYAPKQSGTLTPASNTINPADSRSAHRSTSHQNRFRDLVGSASKNILIDGTAPVPLQKPPPGERIDPPVPLPEGLEPNPTTVPVGPGYN